MQLFELKTYLTKNDLEVLYKIYQLRCLTISQLYVNYYKNEYAGIEQFRDQKLNFLIQNNLVEEIAFGVDNSAIFITTNGIKLVVDEFKIPKEIVDPETSSIKRGYYQASDLKMLPKNIPHQVHLNQFVIDFKTVFEHKSYNVNWEYFDEKYVSQYTKIRPDGMIRIMDTDLFLEMDMSTESRTQLEDKWKRYKVFLNSVEHRNNDHKVVVLFIVDNTNQIENRKNLIKLTANAIVLDDIDDKFEIIVGTKNELLTIIFSEIIPDILQTNYKKGILAKTLIKNFDFTLASASLLSSKMSNADYGFFIRKVDESNNVIVENGKLQGFLIEYCTKDSLSFVAKVAYLDRNLASFHYYYKWCPPYIIVCDNLKQVYNELKLYKLETVQNVYFTTIQRLESKPFHEAICQITGDFQVYHFSDSGLRNRIFE